MTDVISVNDPALLFAGNPIVVVVSDIHLGARNNLHPEFLKFLKLMNEKIQQNILTNLKTVVLLGDFLDVLNDSFRDLAKETINVAIYSELNELQHRGVEVLFVLGNHEIRIWGNFKCQKKRFVKRFQKWNSTVEFIKPSHIAQYITIERLPDTTRILNLYDEKCQINRKKPFRTIPLPSGAGAPTRNKYLLCHGHWFSPGISIISALFLWNGLYNAPDFWKEFMNFVFNYEKEDVTAAEIEDALNKWKEGREEEEMQMIEDLLSKKESFMKLYQKAWKSYDRRKNLKKEILIPAVVKYIKHHPKWGIDAVLFGHSHESFTDDSNIVHEKQLLIVNDGAWQCAGKPGYIEIEPSGDVKNFYYEIIG